MDINKLKAELRKQMISGHGLEYPSALGEIRRVVEGPAAQTDADRVAKIRGILAAPAEVQDEAWEID